MSEYALCDMLVLKDGQRCICQKESKDTCEYCGLYVCDYHRVFFRFVDVSFNEVHCVCIYCYVNAILHQELTDFLIDRNMGNDPFILDYLRFCGNH